MSFPNCGDLGNVCVIVGPVVFVFLILIGGAKPSRCARCGHRNRTVARFCARCGTRLARNDDE